MDCRGEGEGELAALRCRGEGEGEIAGLHCQGEGEGELVAMCCQDEGGGDTRVSYSESCLVLVCVSCLLLLVISIWHSVILALVFPSYVSVFMFTFDLSRSTPPVSVSLFGYFRV